MFDEVDEREARSSEIPKSCGTDLTHSQTCSMLFIAMQNCKKNRKEIRMKWRAVTKRTNIRENEQHRRKKFLVIEVREEPQEMSCRESFFGSVHSKNPLPPQRLWSLSPPENKGFALHFSSTECLCTKWHFCKWSTREICKWIVVWCRCMTHINGSRQKGTIIVQFLPTHLMPEVLNVVKGRGHITTGSRVLQVIVKNACYQLLAFYGFLNAPG